MHIIHYVPCLKQPNSLGCWLWWCTPVIVALGRLRHEDCELKANVGYTVRPYLKITRAGNVVL
jgi:hypothetical protein